MSERAYYDSCADGTPVICLGAHHHVKPFEGIHLNVEIGAGLKKYLTGDGAESFALVARRCVDALANPVFESQRQTWDFPVGGLHLLRFHLLQETSAPRRDVFRLGEIFLAACRQVMRDKPLPVISDEHFSTSLCRLYTVHKPSPIDASTLLLQLRVPDGTSMLRLETYASRLVQYVRGEIATARGLPVSLVLLEESESISGQQLFASGLIGSFDPAAVQDELDGLIGRARRDIR